MRSTRGFLTATLEKIDNYEELLLVHTLLQKILIKSMAISYDSYEDWLSDDCSRCEYFSYSIPERIMWDSRQWRERQCFRNQEFLSSHFSSTTAFNGLRLAFSRRFQQEWRKILSIKITRWSSIAANHIQRKHDWSAGTAFPLHENLGTDFWIENYPARKAVFAGIFGWNISFLWLLSQR